MEDLEKAKSDKLSHLEVKEEEEKEFVPKLIQVKFAALYLDTNRRLTQEQMAKEIGVTRKTTYTWLLNPVFRKWLNTRRNEMIEGALIPIIQTSIRRAKAGNYNHARLILEIAGVYQPGMKIDTGLTELIRIEVVQSQAQAQGQDKKGDKIEND